MSVWWGEKDIIYGYFSHHLNGGSVCSSYTKVWKIDFRCYFYLSKRKGMKIFMRLTILGTGNAMVTKYYNTCFVLDDDDQYFMVDAGGGNGIMQQLKKANLDWRKMRDIFVTHKHIDHISGMIWMIRLFAQDMVAKKIEGDVNIYAHDEVIKILKKLSNMLLIKKQAKMVGKRIHLITVEDGEEREIIGKKVTFFDIQSTKDKQFGFTMQLNDEKKLTCCGDEPYKECEEKYVKDSTWLMHEAFCLFDQADIFEPYEKHHSTAKDAAILAEQLDVENLILYHTEEATFGARKKLYTKEAEKYFSKAVYVPDDLETFELL